MISHGFVESAIYILIWSSGVVISLYNLYLAGNEFNHSEHRVYHYDDFTQGWFGRYQDSSDFEWKCWTKLTIQLLPWLGINFLGGMLFRSSNKLRDATSLWYAMVSLLACSQILSTAVAGLFLAIILSFYLFAYSGLAVVMWILGFLWQRYVPVELLGITEENMYLIQVASSWLLLRCFAYSLENARMSRPSLSCLLGYCLYLPTMFCGPFFSFPSFLQKLLSPPPPLTFSRALLILRSFLRCIFWYFFTLLSLHFVYVNAILLRPYMVAGMTAWQLAGLGIAMGHFFHLKYLVFYGLPSCWAAAEGFIPPKSPCCVSRVYLYSRMWRNFDPGLYSFLIRYIYVPVQKMKWIRVSRILSRTSASVACFFFVFIWHGADEYVMFWVLLNFTAVAIEASAREVVKIDSVKQMLDHNLRPCNQRRLHCLLAAPLHYFSMLSNYFFIGSLEIGKIYFNRAVREPPIHHLFIIFFLYGAAQTTVSIEIWEKRNISR